MVYICASYGFIRMDTSDGAKEEDVFMHLVDVDFAPTIKERVTFELARFRERNKAVEVRQCEPGAKRSPPAKAKASVEDPAKEWPRAERLALAADLVAWLEGGAPPGALEAPGELLLASDDVARFFDAHAGHAAAVTRSTLAPSLAVKRAIREQGVAGVAGRVLELAPVPNGCNAGIVKVGTRAARAPKRDGDKPADERKQPNPLGRAPPPRRALPASASRPVVAVAEGGSSWASLVGGAAAGAAAPAAAGAAARAGRGADLGHGRGRPPPLEPPRGAEGCRQEEGAVAAQGAGAAPGAPGPVHARLRPVLRHAPGHAPARAQRLPGAARGGALRGGRARGRRCRPVRAHGKRAPPSHGAARRGRRGAGSASG